MDRVNLIQQIRFEAALRRRGLIFKVQNDVFPLLCVPDYCHHIKKVVCVIQSI